jgi:ankyrin repeat protein
VAKDDGKQSQQAVEEILAGRNAEANELAKELFAEVPDPERKKMISIGRSLLAINQKQAALDARAAEETRAIQARKDLAGMGHVYHDRNQFLDAVRRGDVIAVRLFLVGGGVDPKAKDVWGASALDLAKRNGNPELIALVETAGAK